MNTSIRPCDEFEVAALRRARGALDPEPQARLEAHLLACENCRDFAATAVATEAALRGRVRDAAAGRDWDRVRAAFRARLRRDRNRKLRGFATIGILVALLWWALGPVAGALVATFAGVCLGIAWWRIVLPARRLATRAAAADSDLLAFYRSDLDREIEGLRTARPLVVVFLILHAANAGLMVANVVKELVLGRPFPSVESHVATFVVLTLVGTGMWIRDRYDLPRVERERRELDG